MAQRQDRDTFGVHQNRAPPSSKRNSFSANWEVHSSVTQGTQDDVAIWAKEALDMDKHDGRMSRGSSNWERAESTLTSEPIRKTVTGEQWDLEQKSFEKKNYKEPVERPTFRTHQFNKSAQEREKKMSVSTQNTEKPEKELHEWPEFMRPIHTPPKSKSPVTVQKEPQSPKTSSRLLPLGASACVTYNRVSWLLRVRKEVFSPAEPIGPPAALHLVFCQIVADVYGVTSSLRLTQTEKRAGMTMLSGYGVTADNLNSPHRANIKRNVVELARTWPLYFSRLFPVSGAAQVGSYLSIPHFATTLIYCYFH